MASDSEPPSKKHKHTAPLTTASRIRLAKELLQNHPVIWDRDHPKFHLNSVRDAAWLAVATKLDLDLGTARDEWKRFRSMYFASHRRRINRGDRVKTGRLHKLLEELFAKSNPSANSTDEDSSTDGESQPEEATVESGLQCHLCLRWTTNPMLSGMFEEISPLIPKIRDVLGIYLAEKGSKDDRKVCCQCRQLIGLIEEFRKLCQLTNELHQTVRIRVVDEEDATGWKSCTNKVAKVWESLREQQRLVEQGLKQEDNGFGDRMDEEESVEIKEEDEDECESGKDDEDRLKLSPIKKEEEKISVEDEASMEEDPTNDDEDDENRTYELFQVVEEESEESTRIQPTEPTEHSIKSESDDEGNPPDDKNVDHHLSLEMSEEEDELEESPVESTRKARMPASDHKFSSSEERLKFAQVCLDNPIIWNRKLPEHHANSKIRQRNITWDKIGQQFGISREVAKIEYKRLRNIHQSRGSRLASGELQPDDYLIVDPLFPVLCKMMGPPPAKVAVAGARTAVEDTKQPKRQQRKRPEGGRKERNRIDYEWSLRFAVEIEKMEPFWNVEHADHTRPNVTKLMAELATLMQCDVATIRREWKRFGEMHRRRLMGQAQGREPRALKQSKEEDALQALLDKFFAYKTIEEGNNLKFSVKPRFDTEGCIAQERRGVIRYVKICEQCGKHVERSLFEAHMNRHRGVKPYECRFEGCEGRYTTRLNRDRHENIYHTREGFNIECDQCGERFKHKSSLDFHYAVRHKSENVPCGICQKVFKHDRHLDFHMQKQHSVKLSSFRKSMAAIKAKG